MPKRRLISPVVCALLIGLATGSAAAPPSEGFVPVEGGLRVHYRIIGHGKETVIIPLGLRAATSTSCRRRPGQPGRGPWPGTPTAPRRRTLDGPA
jgi:hypothetical protein